MLKYVVGFLSLGMFTSAVFATPIINVGSHQLQPNTAGQTIQLFVSGGDAVAGVNFYAQIDGGGSAVPGGVDVGPIFTNLDILTGTIFATNNNGQSGGPGYPQLAIGSTVLNSGSVAADGLLATLTVDTTGVSSGDYAFLLSGTLNGDTDFADVNIYPTITNGTIHVTPEPASMALLGLGSLVVLRTRRRRQS
ncbi:MAG: PEP-CTERM sorting domain-containing protein [bacterium]|nr:PEP-CTERM sorting domain-containing protein [bacterium]